MDPFQYLTIAVRARTRTLRPEFRINESLHADALSLEERVLPTEPLDLDFLVLDVLDTVASAINREN
jgi:hypothetical protein